MLKALVTEKERSVLQKFTAPRGWVEKFVRRHALRSVALHVRSAKRAFLTAKHDRKPTPIRQMLISECL